MRLIQDNSNYLEIALVDRFIADGDYRWPKISIRLISTNFTANYDADVTYQEMMALHSSLITLKPLEKADFETMEPGLRISALLDVTGNTYCKITCENAYQDILICTLTIDCMSMERFISELKRVFDNLID